MQSCFQLKILLSVFIKWTDTALTFPGTRGNNVNIVVESVENNKIDSKEWEPYL